VDTAEGAAVRIAMTVGTAGEHSGELLIVTGEEPQPDGSERFHSSHSMEIFLPTSPPERMSQPQFRCKQTKE